METGEAAATGTNVDVGARAAIMELTMAICGRLLERKQMFPDDVTRILTAVEKAWETGKPGVETMRRFVQAHEARERDISVSLPD